MSSLVSIVIPCYNAERWVRATVDSALAQTWQNIEVVAVNDGSRDASLSVLKSYSGTKVRVIDQPNRGASAARNAGLSAARGEFIQFLDADDLMAPGKIESQMTRLKETGEGRIASARWARFRENPADSTVTESPLFRDLTPVDFMVLYASGWNMMHPAAWLVPAEIARKAGPWDETLSLNDDGEYFARVVLAAKEVVHVPLALTFYRSGLPQSLSGRRDRKSLESLYRSCELIGGYMERAEDSPRVRQALADHFQRLVYEIYPEAPDLCCKAQARARALGGSAVRPPMGRRQAVAALFLGWRLARRVAIWLARKETPGAKPPL